MQMRGALGCSLKVRHGKNVGKITLFIRIQFIELHFRLHQANQLQRSFSRANLPQFSMYTFFCVSLEFMPRFNGIIFLIVSRYKASCSWWGFSNIQRWSEPQAGELYLQTSRHFSSQVRFVFLGNMWIYPWRVAWPTFAPVEVLWDRSLSRLPSHLDLLMRIP